MKIVIIILFLIFMYFFIIRAGVLLDINYWKNRNKTLHTRLRNALRYTITKLESNDLKPFLTAGTLLGAVRENDIIAWDDDLDIAIYVKDKANADNTVNLLERIYEDDRKYKFGPLFGIHRISHRRDTNIFVDVIMYIDSPDDKDKLVVNSKLYMFMWPQEYLLRNEIDLENVNISDNVYKGPSDSHRVLKRWYGDDCIKTGKPTHKHRQQNEIWLMHEFDQIVLRLLNMFKRSTIQF